MNSLKKYYRPILLFFVMTTALITVFGKKLIAKNVDVDVLHIGNVFLLLLALFSVALLIKAMRSSSTPKFLSYVYASIFGKLLISIIAIFIYVQMSTKVNKVAIFILLGFYLVYTFLNINIIKELTKEKNAQGKTSI